MTVDEMVKWINQLYAEDNIHRFYIWKAWRKVRDEALRLQHYECQRCKREKRIYTKATVGHHKQPLRKFPWLALTVSNIEALCEQCHYDIEHPAPPKWNDERW